MQMPALKMTAQTNNRLREIGAFAFPVFLEQFSIAFMSVMSTVFVASAGTAAVSGVSLIESMNYLIQQPFLGLEIGAVVVIAQYCGRGDFESASKASIQAMITSFGVAMVLCVVLFTFPDLAVSPLLGKADKEVYEAGRLYFRFTVLSFPLLAIYSIAAASLRGSGSPRLSLIGVVITNASFILIGFILVKGFDKGITGVGTALIFARLLGASVGIFLLVKGKSNIIIRKWIPEKINWNIQKMILTLGIPAMIENMVFQGGRLITQTYTVALGTAAMATNALSNSIAGFYNIPGNTASVTAVPIIGKYLGMRNKNEAKASSKMILILSILSLTILSVILIVLAGPVAGLFTSDKYIADSVIYVTRWNLIVSPFVWTTSFVTPAILRASGDIRFTTIVSVSSMLLFRVTLGYLFAFVLGWGVIGIWAGMFADWTVRSILFGGRYLKGRWTERVVIKD